MSLIKTIGALRKLFQGVFHFAVDSGYIDTSPARDLNLKLDGQRYICALYKGEVLKMIRAASEEKVMWQRWLPVLAA